MSNTETYPDTMRPTNVCEWAAQLMVDLRASERRLRPNEIRLLDGQIASLVNAGSTTPAAASAYVISPVIVSTLDELAEAVEVIESHPVVALDIETSSLDPAAGEIVGVGLAVPQHSFYIPIAHRLEATRELRPDQLPLCTVAAVVGFDAKPFVAHNAKFELKWLRHHLAVTPRFVWDTMLAAQLLRSDRPAGLKQVATRQLDVPDWGLAREELAQIQFLPVERAAWYCGHDAAYTLRLFEVQQACLI
jgi:DNA polymerase-1